MDKVWGNFSVTAVEFNEACNHQLIPRMIPCISYHTETVKYIMVLKLFIIGSCPFFNHGNITNAKKFEFLFTIKSLCRKLNYWSPCTNIASIFSHIVAGKTSEFLAMYQLTKPVDRLLITITNYQCYLIIMI